ncbi:peptidoglycan endopeptidase [Novosphingopyxis sp.]|uniref:peptidoglycan endopeptidase n=1 Tax=Novosphingopyxis sp. TaxID=2709690 RepID=UPI003B5ABA2B
MSEQSAIAERALALVGTPFRLGGRDPASGIDCIGLAALALGGADDVPSGYALRGGDGARWHRWFEGRGFAKIAGGGPGDLCLVRAAPLHFHLLVAVTGGFVHAHAGLRRTVFLPGASLWPIDSFWRLKDCPSPARAGEGYGALRRRR